MKDHRGHQRSRGCRVDHVIDLEVRCGVERLPAFVGFGHHGLELRRARVFIIDRLELLAVGEFHSSLETHPTEFPGGPGDRHERSAETPTRHCLRSESIALAQHHGHERDSEGRAGEEQAARVTNQGSGLRVGSDHDPRRVAEKQHRNPERLAQLQKARRFVGTVARDRSGEMHRIVGDDPHRVPFNARKRGHHAAPEARAQLKRGIGVGDDLDGSVDVVGAPPVLGHDVAQRYLVRHFPVRGRALKERERVLRKAERIGLVGRGDIDHAVLHLDIERPDLVGVHHSEASALDHRRAAHADARVRRRDDQVGAAEERRVAREAPARRDPDSRHHTGEPCPQCERHHVETGDHGVVGVTGPSPAALGEEHDRHAAPLDDLEEAVLLAMPHHALGAGEHCVIV